MSVYMGIHGYTGRHSYCIANSDNVNYWWYAFHDAYGHHMSMDYHILAGTWWALFSRRHFQMHFLERKGVYLGWYFTYVLLFVVELIVTRHWFRQWASYQIHNIAGAHAPEMPGTFSPQPRVSDPDMHHGTCVTHVPWCMPGSLASGYRFLWSRPRGKTFPAFPAHAQLAIWRIW